MVALLMLSATISAQTYILGITSATACGCSSSCNAAGVCAPTASGNCPVQTVSTPNISVPTGSNVRVQCTTVACDVSTHGLDGGDNFFVNGVQVVTGASNTPVNYDQCFNNTSGAPITVNASLTANRKDETVQVVFTITAGTPGTCSASIPLPIKLNSFHVETKERTAFFTWTTATEANNSYFAIERSANGKDFQTIGTVGGAGTSATEKNYQFTDAAPLRGINYYRLKQMDFDGRSEYSEIKAVKMSSGGLVSLRPTEASEQLVITLQEAQIGNSELAIFDQLGRVIYRTNIAEGSLEALVNVGNFNAGAYFVRIGTGSESSVLRFIKIKD